ncbi:MAG: PD40 domain-containing protein [Anaerolineae bacterium]|nr:PD40 domain-containing protein [Anaerolineae bacterium]
MAALTLGGLLLFASLTVGAALLGAYVLPNGGQISFEMGDGGHWDIYLLDVQRGIQHNLTNHPATDEDYTWSPDGRRLAFVSERDGSPDIYVIEARCADWLTPCERLRNLSNSPAEDTSPSWSPDGTALLFVSNRDTQREIYRADVHSGALLNLTHTPADERFPYWSPDGERIAFQSERSGTERLYVMQADGSAAEMIGRGFGRAAVWSPDGQNLLFVQASDLFLVDVSCADVPDGCRFAPRNITLSTFEDWYADWSPDGRYLLFHSNRSLKPHVYLADMTCADQVLTCLTAAQKLTNDLDFHLTPDWSRDGASVVLLSNDSGQMQLYAVDIAGRTAQQLTRATQPVFAPRWRPG